MNFWTHRTRDAATLLLGLRQTAQMIVDRSRHVTCDEEVDSIKGQRQMRAGNGVPISCSVMAVRHIPRSIPLHLYQTTVNDYLSTPTHHPRHTFFLKTRMDD